MTTALILSQREIEEMTRVATRISIGGMGVDIVYCIEEGKFYYYDNQVWRDIFNIEILGMILKHEEFRDIVKYTAPKRAQVLETLKILTQKRLECFNKHGYLNFEFGEFNPQAPNPFSNPSGAWLPHKKENYSTIRIEYPQMVDTSCPLWLKTLNEMLEGDQKKVDVLQEFFGYCLTRDTTQRKALLLLGECLGGETLIYDPIKNKSIPVSDIKEDFHVEAWDGEKIVIAKALKPFTKEIDKLYEVTLSNGKRFVCSMTHKILTSSGYLPLSELHEGAEVFLPSTILDNGQQDQLSNENRYQDIIPNLINDYRSLYRFYGVQLRKVRDNVQASFLLQGGVQEYDLENAFLRMDVMGNRQEHNHFCQSSFRPATSGVYFQTYSVFYKLYYISCIAYELILYHIQVLSQSMSRIFHFQPTCKSSSLDNNSYSISPYNPPCLVITNIVYKRIDVKYDFTVPIYNNYICSGAVHHNSNCGKSTVLQVLRAMIGTKNCSSVPLKLINHQQHTPLLINKLVNIDSDVSAKAEEFEAQFKIITSGEPIQCNQKFIPTFDFVPYCKIVMAANIFPKITDHSSAFYNRLILIPFNRIFPESEQNKKLFFQLQDELWGIFNWSVEGLERLYNRGMFEQLDFLREAVKELEDENNPTNVFFDEHIEVEIGDHVFIEKGDLYEKYKKWCELTKNYTLSLARFSQSVYKRYHKETPAKARILGGKRIWRNLKYVDNKEMTMTYTETVVSWNE